MVYTPGIAGSACKMRGVQLEKVGEARGKRDDEMMLD